MTLSICNVTTDSNGRELAEHGTALFPVSCYEDNLNNCNVPWHWHDEFEVLFVLEGKVTVSAGRDKYILTRGDGFFINAGILHEVNKGDSARSRIRSIVFHPRIVGSGVDSIYWHKYIQPIISNPSLRQITFDHSAPWHTDAVKEIRTAWNAYTEEKSGYEFVVRSELSRLILHLSENRSQNEKSPSAKNIRDNERLKGMLLFIRQHYTNPITVSMIAGSVLISESECMRCFRASLGISPIKYLKQFRLQKAADLLIETDDKIIDIGLSCGFQDTSYFIKSFKEVYGVTPNVYQKEGSPTM